MKKALIPIVAAMLVAALFTGCRKNVATETTDTTGGTNGTTASTAAPSTARPTETERPTETTRPTQATRPSTQPSATQGSQAPSVLPETSGPAGDTGRGAMPPRF